MPALQGKVAAITRGDSGIVKMAPNVKTGWRSAGGNRTSTPT